MSVKKNENPAERAYQQAMEIIDREWLAAGVAQEELNQEEQLAEIFDRLVGSGRTVDGIRTEWETKTVEEILREYTSPVPARRNA